MRVVVDRDGVTVVIPHRAADRRATEAVLRLEPWIRDRLAEQAESLATVAARGMTVPWLGETLTLEPQPGRKSAHRADSRILVPEGDHRPALERLLRRSAREEITARLDRVATECGHTWASLRIGDMKSRWASCSSGGRMSFSWRLMMAPDEVLETIVWHEVTHLDVPNHSQQFWRLMDSRRPEHRAHSAWLNRHGRELAL